MDEPMSSAEKNMSTANGSLPRVSTILRVLDDAYAGVPQAMMQAAAERGEILHRLCLTYLVSLDGVHEAPVPTPDYVPAYTAFVEWVTSNGVLSVAIEQKSENKKHGYCGTPDALVIYKGAYTLIDLKFTASILRINRVQLQAYRRLDEYREATHSLILHIDPRTGHLKQENVKNNPRDWAAFLNALSILKWRMQ